MNILPQRPHHSQSAFTLIELIVVIAVIGILLTVAVLGMRDFQSRSKKTSSVAVAEQVKLKLSTYFQSRNRYPATQTDVTTYLSSNNAADLATKFGNTATYTYNATMADGSACTLNGTTTCDKYTITVKKTAWNGNSTDTDVTVTP